MFACFLSYNIGMKIYNEIKENKNISLALGFFDGIHIGHQKVIKSAVEFAKENNTKSAVITFKEHPCCFFKNLIPSYIMSKEEKYNKIEELGIDYLYEIDFTDELAKMSAENYLKDVLINHFNPISISTGFNHYFGANKNGSPKLLRENAGKYGYKYIEIEPQQLDKEVISSTLIRDKIIKGEIDVVEKFLGRPFKISGIVREGEHLASKIGYKTANIEYPKDIIKLRYGVYKTVVNDKYTAIANFGTKPTFMDGNEPLLEVHILNFDKNIYNERIDISFKQFIREEQKFNTIEELREQIKKDITKCLM